jgi:hypothetical protein
MRDVQFPTLSSIVLCSILAACSGGGFGPARSVLPGVSGFRIERFGALPVPFDERFARPIRRALPITAAQLGGFTHINPITTQPGPASRRVQNTSDADNGGQSGYIIAPGSASGDGSIYVAMTAYDDAWITTPTDGPFNSVNAPTSHGPNGNCIEIVTNYYNGFGTPGTTVDQVQFYDFCANNGHGAFVGAIPIDADFIRDYVRMYADDPRGLPRYVSAVIHYAGDGRWHAYLYDASLMQYVDYYDSSSGASTTELGGEGWSIFETHYNGGACGTLPDASVTGVNVRTSAGWQPLEEAQVFSYMWGTCFTPPLSDPYYLPVFNVGPAVAWTVTSQSTPALSEYARTILADAPAAYYRLDDNGPTAADSSGVAPPLSGTYGANVNTRGPSLLSVEAADGAAQFNGGSAVPASVISIPGAPRLQPVQSLTVEAWVSVGRADTTPVDLVSYGSYGSEPAAQAYTLQLLPNGAIGAAISTAGGRAFVAGNTILAPHRPYLVDATYDGSNLAIDVDGSPDASVPLTGQLTYPPARVAQTLSLGAAVGSSGQALVGTLDEVAVYRTALTPARIAAHWTAGSGLAVAPPVSEYVSAVRWDSPLAFYRLSDATNVAVDATANHIDAAYGAAVERDVAGLVLTDLTNNGAQFPGGASSPAAAVTTGRTIELEPPQTVSVEAWLELTSDPAETTDLVSYGPHALGQPYTLQVFANGTVGMLVSTTTGTGVVHGRTVLGRSVPHIVDATYDGTIMKIYVDGALDNSEPLTGPLDYRAESPADGLSMGTSFDDPGGLAFAGELDDVAVYGRALSAQRVWAHWAAGTGHVAAPAARERR